MFLFGFSAIFKKENKVVRLPPLRGERCGECAAAT